MNDIITPLVLFYQGPANLNETLYQYTATAGVLLQNYRLVLTGAYQHPATIDIRINGVMVDQIVLSGADSGVVVIPSILLQSGQVLTLVVSANTSAFAPTLGLGFTFGCSFDDPIETGISAQQIQTPLIGHAEGVLALGIFFTYTFQNRVSISMAHILSRIAPTGAPVIVAIARNGSTVVGLDLSASTLDSGDIAVDLFFDIGDTLTAAITQIGSIVGGTSLTVLLDYSNVEQTEFSSYQTPFVVPYDALATDSSKVLMTYVAKRDLTIAIGQAFLSATQGVNVSVGIYRNGAYQKGIPITAGLNSSPATPFSIPLMSGDTLQLKLDTPTFLNATNLIVTLDNFIALGQQTFGYYSDPDWEIVLIVRALGIGAAKSDNINFSKLDKYKRDVDSILNAQLRALYRTPLVPQQASALNPWPWPIAFIAQRLVAYNLLFDAYSGVEPNSQQTNLEGLKALAMDQLTPILRREFLLNGQRLKSRAYGSDAYSEPLYDPNAMPPPNV